MASTNIQTFPGKVGVSNTNPIHTLDIGSNVYIDDTAQTKLRIIGNIHASGVTVDGTITAIDSENLSVKDPIILLASGSTGTSDTGIIMKRADGDSNVAVFYDEGVGLKIGHTLSTAQDIHISVDSSNSLSTSIYGPVTVAHSSAQALVVQGGAEIADDFKVGASKLFVDVSESNVGIGTDAPLATLDVHGTANVGALTVVSISGDGSGLSSIQSSNVSDFASNVTRIGTLETDLGSNVTRIGTLETDLGSNVTRIGTLETDLGSNVTRITNLESSDMTIGGEKTFSSSLTVGGDVTVTDTTSGSAAGPEFSLYRNQTGTNGDYLGQLRFDGKHDGGNDQLYAKITGKIKKADQGGEDGVIETAIITDGSQRISLRHTGDLFHIKKGTDFQVGETANLYVDTSTSRVGIGMSNPESALDISSTSGLMLRNTSNKTGVDDRIGYIEFYNGETAGGNRMSSAIEACVNAGGVNNNSDLRFKTTLDYNNPLIERMRIDRSGNVGIGTTSPQYKLDVDGGTAEGDGDVMLRMFGGVNKVGKLIFGRTGNSDIRSHAIESITNSGGANNYMKFLVHDGGNSPPYETRTEVMTLLGNGNVGIGTTSPLQTLHVAGNGQNPVIYMADSTNTRYASGMGTHHVGNEGQRLDFYNGDSGANGTSLGSSHIRMSIKHNGNVGIGTTSPSAKLHINTGATEGATFTKYETTGNGYGGIEFRGTRGNGTNGSTIGQISSYWQNNTRGSIIFNDGGDIMILPTRNVGIGTASPSQILHLLGQGTGSGPKIRFETLNNGNGDYTVDGTEIGGIQFAADDLTWATQHTSSEIVGIHRNPNYSGAQGDLVFKTSSSQGSNPTEKMRINHDGNVGIGLTTPTYDLDVRGGLAVSYADNNAMKIDGGGTLRRHYTGSGNNYGAGLHFTSDAIWPTNYAGSYVNNQIDLGHSNYKWKGVHTEYLACGGSGGVPATFTSSAAWQTAVNIANSTVPNNTWSFLLGGSGNNTGAAGVGSLGFYVNNGTGFVMNLNANGNVGIGTTNPGVPLDIKTTGNYNGIGLLGSSSGRYTLSTNGNGTELIMSHGSYSFGLWRNAHHYDVYSGSNFSGSRDFYLNYYSGANVRLSGGTVVTSDDRIKTEERYIENATETLLKLKPQIYLKGPNIGSTSNVSRIESGLIAQDVYYDAPELRHLVSLADDAEPTETKPYTDDDPQNDPDYSSWGSKSAGLEYEGLIAYLIKSNQELYTEIQAEKEKTATLETQVAALLERVTALENA